MTQNEDLTQEEKEKLLSLNIHEEYAAISRNLDKYHAIFYQIWEMGVPRLSFEVPTAAVRFDEKGKNIEFLFNPVFWRDSDTYTKEFVICHECLHVILNHGMRIKDMKASKLNNLLANQCLDVVINHMLVDKFNFDRQSVQNQEKYCWIDTVFGQDHQKIDRNRAFEYYLGQLKNRIVENIKNNTFVIKNDDGSESEVEAETIDAHDFLESIDDEKLKKELASEINKKLNENDKRDFIEKINKTGEGYKNLNNKPNSQEGGTNDGGLLYRLSLPPVRRKRKWETVINKWSKKYKCSEEGVEQWVKINRRIANLSNDLILPSEADDENYKEERINVWFFLDTSGSCINLKERFFSAAKSLPNDKFNIRLFCFDTQVYDVNIADLKVYGGGGTSFRILEEKIQQTIRAEKIKYPEAVFVISDGYGDMITVAKPKRWYWFLTTAFKSYIPQDSSVYLLSHFE